MLIERRDRKCLRLAAFVMTLLVGGCVTNPAIDREQLILVSESQMASLASQSWADVEQSMPASSDTTGKYRVRSVANRVLIANGETPADWEVKLFQSDDLNAFALPGGKIGVTSAMLAFCQTDDELATVIGHEIAHVKLRHSAERVSQQMATQGAIDLIGGESADAAALLGLGATVGVILPYSRTHEFEADRLGLQYLKRAGYRPQAAIDLWTRMKAQKSGARTPGWLSTHPATKDRIAALKRETTRLGQEPSS